MKPLPKGMGLLGNQVALYFFTYGKHIPEKQHKQQNTERVSQTNK